MMRRLVLIFMIRLPFFVLILAALGVCSLVIWVYEHTPADWLEGEDS